MVRYRLAELLAEHSFQLGRRVTLAEVSDATDVRRSTLSRIVSQEANVTVDTLEKLCRYFGVGVGALVEFPEKGPNPARKKPGRKKRRSAAKAKKAGRPAKKAPAKKAKKAVKPAKKKPMRAAKKAEKKRSKRAKKKRR